MSDGACLVVVWWAHEALGGQVHLVVGDGVVSDHELLAHTELRDWLSGPPRPRARLNRRVG